jgi:hypothetical protein
MVRDQVAQPGFLLFGNRAVLIVIVAGGDDETIVTAHAAIAPRILSARVWTLPVWWVDEGNAHAR